MTYTITLHNPGFTLQDASFSDTLPPGVAYAGNLLPSSGQAEHNAGTITWAGAVPSNQPVTVQFDVTIDAGNTGVQAITNQVVLEDGQGGQLVRQATLFVNGVAIYLPVIQQ